MATTPRDLKRNILSYLENLVPHVHQDRSSCYIVLDRTVDSVWPGSTDRVQGGGGALSLTRAGCSDHKQRIQTRGLFPGPGNLTPYRTSTRADSPTLSCADFMLTVHYFQRLQQHRAQIIQSAPILAPKVPSFQQAERDMTRETFS